jgi:lipid A ethanolaminephosphotransferase
MLINPNKSTASIKPWQLHLIASIFLLLIYNLPFWSEIKHILNPQGISNWLFMASIFVLLLALINLLLHLLCYRLTYKIIYIFIFIGSSMALYFIQQYNIIIDRDMVQNVIETNPSEAFDFVNSTLFIYLFFLGILPLFILFKLRVKFCTLKQELVTKFKVIASSFITIALLLYVSYPSYASLARGNRHISHIIVPTNFVFASISYTKQRFKSARMPLAKISQDVKLGQLWQNKKGKTVVILVLGETARADHFSLNGYDKITNPKLAQQNVINFEQTTSCGTSTAISLPCMFSHLDKDNFSKNNANNSENILDFIANSGFSVQWRDNNTGCKGICERVDFIDLTQIKNNSLCITGECFDEILLKDLRQQIIDNPNNQVIVMHQKGSHGPAYYLRYPEEFKQFIPVCATNKLQNCDPKDINNAYDNTILYTDHVVDQVIEELKQLPSDYNTALVYISDHGESLGENNIYLHGTPYFMAPEAQTHVPFLLWFSNKFMKNFNLNTDCLNKKTKLSFSHDNLFHSMLGLLDLETSYYQPEMDIFASCRVNIHE